MPNATLLFREIRERGYKGSRQMVSNHTSTWRTSPRSQLSQRKKLDRIAPMDAAILACRPADRLSEQQGTLFEQVAVNCPSIRSMRFLALNFREAITSNDRDGMLHWIHTAAQSGFGPLVRFAYGLRKDGQTKGQINRLRPSSARCMAAPDSSYSAPACCPTKRWLRELHRKCGRSHYHFAPTHDNSTHTTIQHVVSTSTCPVLLAREMSGSCFALL
jgi:hypothetical protein